MRSARGALIDFFDNPVLVGALTILVAVVAVYVSYVAENGLPFLPTYDINVQVADGGELSKNVDVRIGGARVGQVLQIVPEPANKNWPRPFAQVQLQLERGLEPLPADTRYQVRLASILGGQYVELFPGNNRSQTVPDGGTLTLNKNPALNHNIPFVDISQAFDVFGPRTQAGLRSITTDLGDAFAGRGAQLNDAIATTSRLIPGLDQLLTMLSSPSTQLTSFISGLSSTTRALAPVAPTVSSLLRNAAATAGALDRTALGTSIDELPATESTGASILTRSLPVLRQAAGIARELKPAAAILPAAAHKLDVALRNAPAVVKLLPGLSAGLNRTLAVVVRVASDPAGINTFRLLGTNDLGTTGASAFVGLGALLNSVDADQRQCDLVDEWLRGFGSSLSEGNAAANWLRVGPVSVPGILVQPPNGQPAANLHINSNPVESGGQCQAGNETYTGAQAIDHPTTAGSHVDDTSPPAGVYQRAQKAGLVP